MKYHLIFKSHRWIRFFSSESRNQKNINIIAVPRTISFSCFRSVGIVRTMWQRLFREDTVVSEVYVGLFAGRRWSVRMKWLAHAPPKNSLLGSDWQALCISSSSQGSRPDIQFHLWLSKRVCSCVFLRVRNLKVRLAILFQEDIERRWQGLCRPKDDGLLLLK